MDLGNRIQDSRQHNIAILLSGFGRGGAERVASLLSRYFYEKGYGVYLFVNKLNRETDYPYWGTAIQVTKEDYKELLIFDHQAAKLLSLKSKAKAIRKLKKKYHIDYSISFMDEYNLLNVMSRYKDRVYLRVCNVMSANDVAKQNGWDFSPGIIGHYYNQSTKVIVVNEAEKTDLNENYFVRMDKFYKIINPIRPAEFMSKKRDWKFGTYAVVCVGRMIDLKQQHHLVRAFYHIRKRCPQAELIFVGNGESKYFQYVRRLTVDMGLEDAVHFAGQQTDVGFYLRNGQVFVSASRTEGYPNSILEALTVGIPVVAADGIGGVGEILNGSGHYIHPKDQVMECRYGVLTPQLDGKNYSAEEPLTAEEVLFAQAITNMLLDKNLQIKYRGAASEFVKANNLETVGERWERLFKNGK